jgi:hypothetical protein
MPPFRLPTLTRSFSALSRVRTALRLSEAHPYERYPLTQSIAKPDWGKHVKDLEKVALLYVPTNQIRLRGDHG